ncbi:hypothetical protein ACXR6G_02910 [Ancylomarina sp. YFZ004]
MKNFLIRLIKFSIPLIFFAFGIASYNYWLDPFGVLKGDMKEQKTEPNQRYLKIKYCIDNPGKYNSFLFGSSRVGKIDVTKIPDSNSWYNFTYSVCLPNEILGDVKILLRNDVKIKRILIGLDEISYLVSPESHENQSLRRPYKNLVDPYLYYLFLPPSYSMYNSIKTADTSKFYSDGAYEVIYTSGCFSPNKKDIFIEDNPNAHVRDSIFTKPSWSASYEERIDKTINEINEINELCKTNRIEVVYFINPIFKETYLAAVSHDFFLFLEKLASKIQYYDFSGINEITTNKLNYYEANHYRLNVGDEIIQTIFNSKLNVKIIVNTSNLNSIIKLKQIEINKERMPNRTHKPLMER